MLEEDGRVRMTSRPYSPRENGKVESKVRYLNQDNLSCIGLPVNVYGRVYMKACLSPVKVLFDNNHLDSSQSPSPTVPTVTISTRHGGNIGSAKSPCFNKDWVLCRYVRGSYFYLPMSPANMTYML